MQFQNSIMDPQATHINKSKSQNMKQTPSQTIGPYFGYGLTPGQYGYEFGNICGPVLAEENAEGEHIIIRGQVFDANGNSIDDAMIEIWQPDSKGVFQKEKADGFISFGRCGTGMNESNTFDFQTIKPGSINGQAPFINVIVFMRGLLSHMYTRIYFSDEIEKNSQDEVLNAVSEDRRNTLIANKTEEGKQTVYTFNIYMQGEKETVFFDY